MSSWTSDVLKFQSHFSQRKNIQRTSISAFVLSLPKDSSVEIHISRAVGFLGNPLSLASALLEKKETFVTQSGEAGAPAISGV